MGKDWYRFMLRCQERCEFPVAKNGDTDVAHVWVRHFEQRVSQELELFKALPDCRSVNPVATLITLIDTELLADIL